MTALLTSAERVMREGRATVPCVIPAITDPMGKHWKQPDRLQIKITDQVAIMTQAHLEQLADYTQSQPSGVYPGKMWKALYSRSDLTCPSCKQKPHRVSTQWVSCRLWIECLCMECKCHWYEKPVWFLKWFGEHPDPKFVSNHGRQIVIV